MNPVLKIFVIALFVFAQAPVKGQNDRGKLKALRTEFIGKRIDLSTAESEKFWPIYNEYNDKVAELRRNLRQSYRKNTTYTEKECEELYLLDIRSRQAEADLHRQYGEKIKNVIGAVKFVKLRQAEEEFKRKMLEAID